MGGREIAVVVPFFNRRGTIRATLASIAAQSLLPRRIVLVDDGSTDGGSEIAASWMDEVRRRMECELVRQANSGASVARNRGLHFAGECQYIAFLDSDDAWPTDFLERAHAALNACCGAVAASSDRQFVDTHGVHGPVENCSSLAASPTLWMLRHGAGICSSSLLCREAVVRRGGFDGRLLTGEDAALFLRMSLDGPWLHVAGAPAVFNAGLHCGSEKNKSRKYPDRYLQWVMIFEEFFVKGGGQSFLADRRHRRWLAYRWQRAGVQQMELGAPRMALHCFRKARAWNPWRASYYAKIFSSWSAGIAQRPRKAKRVTHAVP